MAASRIQDLLYSLINPPMRALLRSPLHRVASRNLGLLCYTGRKSARRFATPLSYVRDGDVVRFLSSHATRWWTNFRSGPTAVDLLLAGETRAGVARLLEGDSEALRDGVRSFLTALPRDAMVYGIKLDADRKPREADIEGAGSHVVLVEVTLGESDTD